MNKEEQKEYYHQYYLKHKEKIKERSKKWAEENREKRREIQKKWDNNNPEYITQYRERNKERIHEKDAQYNQTKIGRGNKLVTAYKHSDKVYGRGECTITGEWIVENIFNSKCHYCGETDWHKLGCDRIDNSKPHTEDNVVPCCADCNTRKMHKDYKIFIKENGQIER